MSNKECNTCIYRREFDMCGTIFISCGYVLKNKYDKRFLLENHCNKYEQKGILADCKMCVNFDIDKGDCKFITCDFRTEQLSLSW